MTDNQYKIFKAVRKYRTLPEILTATGISDYLTLQEDAGVGMLDFSDCEMDEKTIVTLTNPAAMIGIFSSHMSSRSTPQ